MRGVYGMFHMEMKRYFSRKNMIAWLIILILLLVQANIGVNKVKKIPETIQAFKQIQKNYFEKINNYNTYGFEGIMAIIIPSPNIIFSWNSVLPLFLTAHVDSLVKLEIYNDFKGKALIPVKWAGQLDITGIILLLMTLMALWYGFSTFHTPQYTKFMSSLIPHIKTYLIVTLSRFILFLGAFIFSILLVYLFIRLRGISFSKSDLTGIFNSLLVSLVMILVFFAAGVLIGSFGKKSGTYISLITVWILLNFGTFWMINSMVEPFFPDKTQDYQNVLNKYKKMMTYEERYKKKLGKPSNQNIEESRILVEGYYKNDFQQIEDMEKKLLQVIAKNIKIYNRWCLFTPTTLFRMTVNEASGSGYKNYLNFYNYVLNMHRKFLRFWIDRVYYHDPKEMVNFIQGDEDIFRGQSYTPPYFIFGIFINLGFGVILLLISYFCFKRMVFSKTKEPKAFESIEIDLHKGKNISIISNKENFNSQFLNLMFGQGKQLNWKIKLDGDSILNKKKYNFIYLPHPSHIPGELKGKHLLSLIQPYLKNSKDDTVKIQEEMGKRLLNKRFFNLQLEEKAMMIVQIFMRLNKEIFIFDDFTNGIMDVDRFNLGEKAKNLKAPSTMLIDISMTNSSWLGSEDYYSIAYKKGEYRNFKFVK